MTNDLRTRIAVALLGDGCQCSSCTAVAVEKADAVIRELPEFPVKIVTQEQLDALPFLTVIREVRPPRRGVDCGGIYERRTSGWQCIAGTWVEPERNGEPMLPVMVLWKGKPDVW